MTVQRRIVTAILLAEQSSTPGPRRNSGSVCAVSHYQMHRSRFTVQGLSHTADCTAASACKLACLPLSGLALLQETQPQCIRPDSAGSLS